MNSCQTRKLWMPSPAAGRSFGRIINMFKHLGNMGYGSYVLPIMNYAAAVWGFDDYPAPQVLQNKVSRFYLGTHRYAPLPAIHNEMDLLPIKMERWVDMLRYFNRVRNLKTHGWPRIVVQWELDQGCPGRLGDIRRIAHRTDLPPPLLHDCTFDLEFVCNEFQQLARAKWKDDANLKPKLRIYECISSFDRSTAIAKANLSGFQRSLLTKFVSGILPLEIESGRYWNLKIEERICKVCDSRKVEDEMPHIFQCEKLESVRGEVMNVT